MGRRPGPDRTHHAWTVETERPTLVSLILALAEGISHIPTLRLTLTPVCSNIETDGEKLNIPAALLGQASPLCAE